MTRAPKYTRVACFGCTDCAYRWNSARGQAGVYQKCKHCLKHCYPTGFAWQAPNKEGNMNRETLIGHNSDLCGKCIQLGYSCQSYCELEQDSIDHQDMGNALDDTIKFSVKPKLSQKQQKALRRMNSIKKDRASRDFLEFQLDWKKLIENYESGLFSNGRDSSPGPTQHLPAVLNLLQKHNTNIDCRNNVAEIHADLSKYILKQIVDVREGVYFVTIDEGLPLECLEFLQFIADQTYGEFVVIQ